MRTKIFHEVAKPVPPVGGMDENPQAFTVIFFINSINLSGQLRAAVCEVGTPGGVQNEK